MKNLIFALLTIFTLGANAQTNPQLGVKVDFSYQLVDGTIFLTDNSVITDTDSNIRWNISYQLDTITTNNVDNHVNYIGYRVEKKVDTVFAFAYPSSGIYHVTLIYNRIDLSPGGIGSIGGTCTNSKDVIVKIDTATTTGIFTPLNETVKANIFSYRKEVTIQAEDEIKQVQVYNVTGQLVFETQMNSTHQTFSLPQLNNGIYIVTAQTTDNKAVSKKLILQ